MPDSSVAPPRPILLDTDIGTDIDDVYALILAASSPEFDLRAVTVVNCDVGLRARLARQTLALLGRADVPVGVGAAVALTPGACCGWGGHEGLGFPFSDDVSEEDVSETGPAPEAARRIADCAEAAHTAGTPLTVCTIGAMTNLALALRCYPEATRKVKEVIAMASDFGGFGAENARREHNIECDSVAAEIVLRSGLPVTLIGLNVTRHTAMTLADVEALEAIGGPLAVALAGMHRVWFSLIRGERSAMHDGLTLALMLDPSLMTLTETIARVETRGPKTGYTRFDPPDGSAHTCFAADSVDADRYHTLLQSRVQEAVRQAAARRVQ